MQRLSWQVGAALAQSGIRPGGKVAIVSGNDPVAFSCVFGISRAGAVWCPVNPRGEAAENRELLDLFDCACLIFAGAFAPLVARIAERRPGRWLVPSRFGRGWTAAAASSPGRRIRQTISP